MLYNKRYSAKALKQSLGLLKDLTEAAAEVSAIFHTYQVLIEETGLPADPQAIEECAQIFQTVNRMMLKEQAELTHLLQMQSSMKKSDAIIKDFRKKKAEAEAAAAKAKAKEETLFSQQAS